MKNLKSLSFLILLLGMNAVAQDSQFVEPDFVNIPYYYSKGSSELKNLAKENAVIKSKIASAYYEVPGITSKVKVKLNDFILVVKAGDFDPSGSLILYKLQVNKKDRSALMASGTFSGKVDMSGAKLQYNLEKISGKTFRIIPTEEFTPGEYLFVAGMSFYTFTVE